MQTVVKNYADVLGDNAPILKILELKKKNARKWFNSESLITILLNDLTTLSAQNAEHYSDRRNTEVYYYLLN